MQKNKLYYSIATDEFVFGDFNTLEEVKLFLVQKYSKQEAILNFADSKHPTILKFIVNDDIEEVASFFDFDADSSGMFNFYEEIKMQ